MLNLYKGLFGSRDENALNFFSSENGRNENWLKHVENMKHFQKKKEKKTCW